jgi:regulator of cell morphogenesis and NO signaling
MNYLSEKELVNDTITYYLERDHHRPKNFQNNKRSNYPRAKEFFIQFKLGLQRHIICEEEVLFPIFEEKTEMDAAAPRK